MADPRHGLFVSAIFITFAGNCRKALTYYQTCFGGTLHFETFEKEIEGYAEMPVIIGSLVSDRIIIHGSDLVHHEGRTPGNHLAVFLHCENRDARQALMVMLEADKKAFLPGDGHDQKLIEVTDAFDVRWVLGV